MGAAVTLGRTNIGLIGPALWLGTLLIIAVVVIGKMDGGFIGATMMGLNFRESLALGTLMNTRGLDELVVLNVGLDLGILTPALFTRVRCRPHQVLNFRT